MKFDAACHLVDILVFCDAKIPTHKKSLYKFTVDSYIYKTKGQKPGGEQVRETSVETFSCFKCHWYNFP